MGMLLRKSVLSYVWDCIVTSKAHVGFDITRCSLLRCIETLCSLLIFNLKPHQEFNDGLRSSFRLSCMPLDNEDQARGFWPRHP